MREKRLSFDGTNWFNVTHFDAVVKALDWGRFPGSLSPAQDTRPPCDHCQGSREGQRWDAEARCMVTVPEGCARCGRRAE